MASLIESYEHQYSGITADITSQIARLSSSDSKQMAISAIEHLLEEAKELLEQMDLEVRGFAADIRPKYSNRLKSYEKELGRLEKEFRRSKASVNDKITRDELMLEEYTLFENQKASLLDNTERLERTGKTVNKAYEMCLETEQVGGQILGDLHSQREQINRTRERLKETDAILGKSSRVLSSMMKRVIQNKIVFVGVILAIVAVIVVGVYFTVRRKTKS